MQSWRFTSWQRHVDVHHGEGSMDIHIITKFAAVVSYACMSMCKKLCKKWKAFAEVTQQSVEHSYNTRHMPPNTCKIIGQQRVMFNKRVNINRIITKFATVVLYTCMILCVKLGKKWSTFAEDRLYLKIDWTQVRGPEHVLNLICLWR